MKSSLPTACVNEGFSVWGTILVIPLIGDWFYYEPASGQSLGHLAVALGKLNKGTTELFFHRPWGTKKVHEPYNPK